MPVIITDDYVYLPTPPSRKVAARRRKESADKKQALCVVCKRFYKLNDTMMDSAGDSACFDCASTS